MSKLSARTQKLLREQGLISDTVERWITFGMRRGVRKDFCGFADIIAFGGGRILAVQVCHQNGIKKHMATILANDRALEWVRSGGELLLIAWRKIKGEAGRFHWKERYFQFRIGEDRKLHTTEVADESRT